MRTLRRSLAYFVAVLTLVVGYPLPGFGQNIDLSTVPRRDTVQLTIYNSEDLTLVRERRKVSFKQGLNRLQFSWSGTRIDPSSVELHFSKHSQQLTTVDTTFPHDRSQVLFWNVESEIAGDAEVEITYFTSGLTWQADYVLVADPDESTVALEGFIQVTNGSGEAYDDAEVRVVVGSINLVEKIAQLANLPMDQVESLEERDFSRLRRQVAKRAMGLQATAPAPTAAPPPKKIIKEGLSEYFIFSIEGRETIPDGWSKRLRSFDAGGVPLSVQYRYRPAQYGDRLMRLYTLRNDSSSKLGHSPLPGGRVKIFRGTYSKGNSASNRANSLAYLATHRTAYVPIGEQLELPLGVDQDVGFELKAMRAWRENIWLKLRKARKYKQVGKGGEVADRHASVVGWDQHRLMRQRLRNFTPRAIKVEIRRRQRGDATVITGFPMIRHDFQTLQYEFQLKAGETRDFEYEIVQREGRNLKQRRLEIKRGQPGGGKSG